MPIYPNRQDNCENGCGKIGMVNAKRKHDHALVYRCRSCFSNQGDPEPPRTFIEDVVDSYKPPVDTALERLRREAERTGDYSGVVAYKQDKAVRDNVQAIIGGPLMRSQPEVGIKVHGNLKPPHSR